MPSSSVRAIWGSVEPDPAEAVRFLRTWQQEALPGGPGWSEEGVLALTPLKVSGVAARSCFASPENMISVIDDSGLDDLIWQEEPCNLYMAAARLKEVPETRRRGVRPYARGTRKDIGWSPGIWADLDVDPEGGKFGSTDDVLDALRRCSSLGVGPSVVVSTGSGGMHGYWRVLGGLESSSVEEMGKRLWVWLRDQTGVALDKVCNADRILRLPGSVRFPKAGEGGDPGVTTLCRVLYADRTAVLDTDRFGALTEGSWFAAQEDEKRRRELYREERAAAEELMESWPSAEVGGGYWSDLVRKAELALLDQTFAQSHSWDEILLPHGWTLLDGDGRPDAEERRTWTRPGVVAGPGVNVRSALTDWIGNPHVMTLKSESPATGLLELVRREIPLSKLRVEVELSWGGDLREFVRARGVRT